MSAITASPARSRRTGTLRRTAEASKLLLVFRPAPRNSTSSAICSDDRVPAPSSSIAAVKLASPEALAGSSPLPA